MRTLARLMVTANLILLFLVLDRSFLIVVLDVVERHIFKFVCRQIVKKKSDQAKKHVCVCLLFNLAGWFAYYR